jgi:hypothetical protein
MSTALREARDMFRTGCDGESREFRQERLLSDTKRDDQPLKEREPGKYYGKPSPLYDGAFMMAHPAIQEEVVDCIRRRKEWVDTPELRDEMTWHREMSGG